MNTPNSADTAQIIDASNHRFISDVKHSLSDLSVFSTEALEWLMAEHFQFSFSNTRFLADAAERTGQLDTDAVRLELERNCAEEANHAAMYRAALKKVGVDVNERVEFMPTTQFLDRIGELMDTPPSQVLGAMFATETAAIFEHEVFLDISNEVIRRRGWGGQGKALVYFHEMHLSGVEQSHRDELGVFLKGLPPNQERIERDGDRPTLNTQQALAGAEVGITAMTEWWSELLQQATALSEAAPEAAPAEDAAAFPRVYTRKGPHHELTLRVSSGDFFPSLQEFQRDWLTNKFMNESGRDLEQTDALSKRFVRGTRRPEMPTSWADQPIEQDDKQLMLQGHQVMQSWEHPIMSALARYATSAGDRILEVGFGMGISATYLLEYGAKSYTVVEPNTAVIGAFQAWSERWPDREVKLLSGTWQDMAAQFTQYDGVLFDPYFVADPGSVEVESSTAVGAFLPLVVPHIRPGGVMTYFTREIDSLSRAHQRMLFKHFRSVEMMPIRDLQPPEDCNYWWADSMMVVKATK